MSDIMGFLLWGLMPLRLRSRGFPCYRVEFCAIVKHEHFRPQESQRLGSNVSPGLRAKYRRAVFNSAVDKTLRDICLEIAAHYEITSLEIGADRDHVHFLVQSVPTYTK